METSNLWITETWIDTAQNVCCGESGDYETFTDDTGMLFKSLQKTYGKCISKMYVDRKDGSVIQTGWVFSKKQKYDDCNEYYIAETWVTVYKSQPEYEKIQHAKYAF